jgi:glycosyltransferase involved in cell wall biosynthesis
MAKNIVKKYKKNPTVTVVMSVYNGEKYLRDSIDSILGQTFKDFEFIIIDDGSTDNTHKILKSYKDPRIVLIARENKGLVASLNEGIGKAKGKYVARQDADDLSHPERLERQYKYISTHKDVAVSATYIMEINLSGKEHNQRRVMSNEISNGFLETSMLSFNPIAHGSVMFDKQLFNKAGGYLENYWPAEDYELWSRMSQLGSLTVIRDKLYYFRVNPEGISLSMPDEQKKKVFQIQKEHLSSLLEKNKRPLKSTHENLSHYLSQHSSIKDKIYIKLLKAKIAVKKNALPNVLIYTSAEDIGGGEVYVESIINSTSNNYNFTVLIPKKLASKISLKKVNKLIYFPKNIFFYNNKVLNKLKPRLYRGFVKFNKLDRYDLLHSQQLDEGILRAIDGVPKIFTMHSELRFNGGTGRDIKRIINLNDFVVCVSDSLIKNAEKLNITKEKIRLIYNGINDKSLKKLATQRNKNSIIWVGRLQKEDKNPGLFLDIVNKMPKSDLLFVMYGDGPYKKYLQNRIENENIKNIRLAGFEKNKSKIYKRAIALCITSEREAMPLNMLEAFSAAVPVISTSVGDAKKIILKSKSGFIAASSEEFCKAIEKIQKNQLSYSDNAREVYLRDFKIDSMLERLFNLYEKAMK